MSDDRRQPGHKGDEVDVVAIPERPEPLRLGALLLAGPVIWMAHFMAVYLVIEAACAGSAGDSQVLGLPVLSFVTLVATAVAVAAIAATTTVSYRAWRAQERRFDGAAGDDPEQADATRDRSLTFAGFLLGLLFALAVLYVGVPALWLSPC